MDSRFSVSVVELGDHMVVAYTNRGWTKEKYKFFNADELSNSEKQRLKKPCFEDALLLILFIRSFNFLLVVIKDNAS